LVLAALVAGAASNTRLVAEQRQVPGAFRSRVVLVPIDVRVLDRDGNPVTDLTRDDFTILEDGRPQPIGHFSMHAHAPGAASPTDARPALRRTAGLETGPPAQRTFLIVLGRGRLNGPANGLDALITFVRERLLPQDYVGLIAYNRTSALTTDRARIVRFLERYRAEHERIETLLRANGGRGSQHVLFGRRPTPYVQRHIDALFADPALPETRTLPPLALDGVERVEADWRRDMAERADFTRGLTSDRGMNSLRAPPITIAGQQDLEKLYVGIEYLRYLEGEKHVIFLSEDSLQIGRPEHHDGLAAVAADARVTLSPIRTGGLPVELVKWRSSGSADASVRYQAWAESDPFFASDNRPVATMTGGVATSFELASKGLDRIDRATRFQYLVGYYPTNPRWDGGFRRIEVRLAAPRPDLTVLHRGGYYAEDELVPYDRREFLSHAWMVSAAAYPDRIADIGVGVGAAPAAPGRLEVEVTVNPAHVRFTEAGGRRSVFFEVAVFVAGDNETPVGEVWRTADVSFTAEDYARLQAGQHIAYRTTIDVTGRARVVKAVVYDYEADRLGTATARVR
jgi:VWFA-related protein